MLYRSVTMNNLNHPLLTDVKYISLKTSLEKSIDAVDTYLLEKNPIEDYIRQVNTYAPYSGFKYRSEKVKQLCRNLESTSNQAIMEAYHKLLLISLIHESQLKVKQLKLPEPIKNYYYKDFNRIVSQIESDKPLTGYFTYKNDRFYKDLAICCLRLFPVGARKYELASFPGKRFLIKGWKQFVKLIIYLTIEIRGVTPFLTGHYDTEDPSFKDEFNPNGFFHAYQLVAEVMKMNPEIKGYFGINWLNDPKIGKISPHLAFIRHMNTDLGCKYFSLGANASTIKDATIKSKTRRQLYEDGKYLPENYAFVLSRKQLIKWADRLECHW